MMRMQHCAVLFIKSSAVNEVMRDAVQNKIGRNTVQYSVIQHSAVKYSVI